MKAEYQAAVAAGKATHPEPTILALTQADTEGDGSNGDSGPVVR